MRPLAAMSLTVTTLLIHSFGEPCNRRASAVPEKARFWIWALDLCESWRGAFFGAPFRVALCIQQNARLYAAATKQSAQPGFHGLS